MLRRSELFARPGSLFEPETGRLYEYDGQEVTVYFPWPQMLAFRRHVLDDEWKPIQPRGRAPVDAGQSATGDPCACFWSLVPARARRAVSPYRDGHWKLLAWMATTGDAACDLISSNPALAFALACYPQFRAKRGQLVERFAPPGLVYLKQREILAWLYFPPSEAVRRILQKIEYRAIDAQRLLALRPRLAVDDVRRRLSHVPRIDERILRMAAEGTLLAVTPRVLHDLATRTVNAREAATVALLRDVVRMWRQLYPRAVLPVFHRLARIAELHDRLVRETERAAEAAPENLVADAPAARTCQPTPPPPPGTRDIVRLTTRSDLLWEGREQHNCVASYAASVARGQRAIYRVLRPQRATLSLVRRRGGWRVEQLKGPANAPVREETRAAILRWLRAT